MSILRAISHWRDRSLFKIFSLKESVGEITRINDLAPCAGKSLMSRQNQNENYSKDEGMFETGRDIIILNDNAKINLYL